MRSENEHIEESARGHADHEDDGHPRASDYMRARRPVPPGALLPLAGFLLLAAVTVVAFVAKGPPVRPQQGAAAEAASGGQPRDMPVSMSYEEELATLEAAVADDPRDTLALAALSELSLSAHNPERAIGLIDQWLEIAPESPNALLQKVMAYASLERWDEALEVNRALYELDPSRLLTRLNMGSLYANSGDMDAARAWWGEIIVDAPDSNAADAARQALAQLDSTPPGA